MITEDGAARIPVWAIESHFMPSLPARLDVESCEACLSIHLRPDGL